MYMKTPYTKCRTELNNIESDLKFSNNSNTYRISQGLTHGHVGIKISVIVLDELKGAVLDQINARHMWHIEHSSI